MSLGSGPYNPRAAVPGSAEFSNMPLRFLRLVGLILAALLAAPAWAQSEKQTRGFLWEATRGSQRVLLLGAIHVGRPAAAMAPASPLTQAEVIAFEANVFDAQAALAATQRWALYPEGAPGLEAAVDKETLARLDKVSATAGIGVPLCCRMKPWMVANTLVVLEAVAAGYSPAYGSEAQLFQYAMANNRQIVEIESLDEQLRLFDEAPAALQLQHLRDTIDGIDSRRARGEIEKLVGAWERGDAAAMEQQLAEMTRGDRASQRFVAEKIIIGRHPKMLAAIDRYAASGRLHLVVIGAMHYFGPGGLVQGLRDRGYMVRRLH